MSLSIKIVDLKGTVIYAKDLKSTTTIIQLKELLKSSYSAAANLSIRRICFLEGGVDGRELYVNC